MVLKTSRFNLIHRQDEPVIYLIDLFAGAGGTSTAANFSSNRIRVIYCINHDKTAIRSHTENHPDCIHSTEDIRYANLSEISQIVARLRRENPNCKIAIWASLECTHFSKAKGGQSRDADSRSLAQHMFRYEAIIKPDFFWFENVREFMTWGPLQIKKGKNSNEFMSELAWDTKKDDYMFVPIPERKCEYYNKWVDEFKRRGFHFESRLLNSADYGGYTIRTRYFGQFSKDPDLLAWPKQTHAKNYEKLGLKPWKAVKKVLELDDHGQSIFARKKPFAKATYERIYAGLIKFVANGDESFLQKYFSGRPEGKVISINGPAGAIKTVDGHALNFVQRFNGEDPASKVKSVDEPIGTMTTQNRHAIVKCEFLTGYYGTHTFVKISDPCGALTTKDRFNKVDLCYLDNQYGKGYLTKSDTPTGALVANPKQSLIFCNPWLMDTNFKNVGSSIDDPSTTILASRKYQYLMNPQFNSKGSDIENPAFTLIARTDKYPPQIVTAEENNGQAYIIIYEDEMEIVKKIKYFMAEYGIYDIKQRMLKIVEMKRIQGFPDDYVLHGTQADQKRAIGNSVEVNVGKALFRAITYNYRLKHNYNPEWEMELAS